MRFTSDREEFSPVIKAGAPDPGKAPSESSLHSTGSHSETPLARTGIVASILTAAVYTACSLSDMLLSPPEVTADPPFTPAAHKLTLSNETLARETTFGNEVVRNVVPVELSAYTLPRLTASQPVQPMVMMGGGEFHPEVAQIFSSWAEDILVIAWASSIPDEYYQQAEGVLKAAGAKSVIRMPDVDKLQENEALELLKNARGVFLTGGKQIPLEERLEHTGVGKEIVRRLRENSLVIAGTSAGCAVASKMMIAGSGIAPESTEHRQYIQLPSAHLTRGAGFIDYPVLVDQHFSQRGREERLRQALESLGSEVTWGIGVDEGTAAIFIDNHYLLVAGKGTVTILPGMGAPEGFKPLVLESGEAFDMHQGERFDSGHYTALARSGEWRWTGARID